jgi:PadR family transcriptional regulator PadR
MYPPDMNLKGTLPVLILHSLQRLPKHGYRIAQDIREKSEGVLDFKEGTLYPTLHALEEKGFIESFTETEQGRVRCYYRLTANGHKELKEQREEWRRYSAAVGLILKEA